MPPAVAGLEARAYVPHDLRHPLPTWAELRTLVPVLGDENEVGVKNEGTISNCAGCRCIDHEFEYDFSVQLRYNYRLDPSRRGEAGTHAKSRWEVA
jgi:hypothetical protein